MWSRFYFFGSAFFSSFFASTFFPLHITILSKNNNVLYFQVFTFFYLVRIIFYEDYYIYFFICAHIRGLWRKKWSYFRKALLAAKLEILNEVILAGQKKIVSSFSRNCWYNRCAYYLSLQRSPAEKQENLLSELSGTFFRITHKRCKTASVFIPW